MTDGGNKVTTERLFWHCGAYTASRKIVIMVTIPTIPYYQSLLFSVARGWPAVPGRAHVSIYPVVLAQFVVGSPGYDPCCCLTGLSDTFSTEGGAWVLFSQVLLVSAPLAS